MTEIEPTMPRRCPVVARNAAALTILVSTLPSCWLMLGTGHTLPEFQGVEDPRIVEQARGTIVWIDSRKRDERLHVLDLASNAHRSVEIDDTPIAISGPDEHGDVALLETTGWWSQGHRIVLTSLVSGASRTILDEEGDVDRWSSRIALAPRGDRLAILRVIDLGEFDYSDPEILVVPLDGSTPTRVPTVQANVSQPRWFPDGRRIAYVEQGQAAGAGETWIFDVESGVRTRLMEGQIRALSVDGVHALVEATWIYDVEKGPAIRLDENGLRELRANPSSPRFASKTELRLVDVATGRVLDQDVQLAGPGYEQGGNALALIAPSLVLHEGLPPRGEEQELVDGAASPGARYPIRLTELGTDHSTVVLAGTASWPVAYSPFEFAGSVR